MSKHKPPFHRRFEDHTYRCHILVCLGGELQDAVDRWSRVLKLPGDVRLTEFTQAMMLPSKTSKDCCIWFRDQDPELSIIAHEAFHASVHVLSSSGVVLSADSEEAWAYHLDFVVRNICRIVDRA